VLAGTSSPSQIVSPAWRIKRFDALALPHGEPRYTCTGPPALQDRLVNETSVDRVDRSDVS